MEPTPLFGPGTPGAWDEEHVFGSTVLRGRDGDWYLWYGGRDRALPRVGDCPLGRIGLATSPDGIRWRRLPGWTRSGCVLGSGRPGRFDSMVVGQAHCLRDGELLFLWYTGSDGEGTSARAPDGRGFGLRIGAAVSRDGRKWVPVDGEGPRAASLGRGDGTAWDSARTSSPCVVRAPDGRWHMYYVGADVTRERAQIGVATSRDGLSWEKVGPVLGAGARGSFDADAPGSASALRRSGRFHLFYEGTDAEGRRRIGLAASEDGVRFSRLAGRAPGGAVLDAGSPGSWDEGGVGLPCAVERPDGEVWLYYTGYAADGRPAGIGLACCEGWDLTRWERWDEGD
ncbi:glycosyl hydrolase [Myxococcota bacterium]|nr:glycosyl hydrolase [Myxococcota bacterium]